MNLYEHTIIAKQETSQRQLKEIIEKYSKIVEKSDGNIVKTENWGLLNLSYLIKKNKKGNYIHFKIKGPNKIVSELEKNEKIDNNLIRYLTVKVKKFDLETEYFSKKEEDKEINKKIFTKSGIMLGLGETRDEVLQVMDDLLAADVDFLTIGQYLQPTVKHFPLDRYVHPDEFAELKSIALSKGFLIVASSPLTRSSYHADEDFSKMKKLREKQAACHPLQ